MHDWLMAVLLGLIEGFTEFIPVSSTGHLILAKDALGLQGAAWDTFIVLIQLGAILAVVAFYFRKLWTAVVTLPSDTGSRRFAISVMVAFLPAMVIGVLLHDFIKHVLFESPLLIDISLIVGGIVLWALDVWRTRPRYEDATKLSPLTSFGIGLFQCLAMIPGVSRSGASIGGALIMGTDKRSAAEFSFFLAIPTMAGAFVYDLYKNRDSLTQDQIGLIAVGFIVSFLSGLAVVRTMLGFVQRRGYWPFAIWRIVVGAAGLFLVATYPS